VYVSVYAHTQFMCVSLVGFSMWAQVSGRDTWRADGPNLGKYVFIYVCTVHMCKYKLGGGIKSRKTVLSICKLGVGI